MSAAKKRNFVHVPFDRMLCPVKGCDTKGGLPQDGTVPGIKRHVKFLHPEFVGKVTFPPIRTTGADVVKAAEKIVADAYTIEQLRGIARKRGVKYSGLNKAQLADALNA